MGVKQIIKQLLLSAGYEVRKVSTEVGLDPFRDLQRLAGTGPKVIIDVGANIGQSIWNFHHAFRQPTIHAFEPGVETFAKLQSLTSGLLGLHLNNYALGSEAGVMQFRANSRPEMSSLLEPSVDCWGRVEERRDTVVKTLDEYCVEQNIPAIDILKSDTQGFDLEVIKGARELLSRRAIHLIYMEVILCDMYKGLPSVDEIYSFLTEQGFNLVSFYQFQYQHPRAAWTDALFANSGWSANRLVAGNMQPLNGSQH
jgi:FkbM family methyltransferase